MPTIKFVLDTSTRMVRKNAKMERNAFIASVKYTKNMKSWFQTIHIQRLAV